MAVIKYPTLLGLLCASNFKYIWDERSLTFILVSGTMWLILVNILLNCFLMGHIHWFNLYYICETFTGLYNELL